MLVKCRSFREINREELMEVYRESNRADGARCYREESPQLQQLLAEDRFCDYLRQDFFSLPEEAYYIWEDRGHYRCALRTEPYQDGILIAGVETHPDYRRRGYAGFLLQAALDDLSRQGYKTVYSHVRKNNTASRRLHESVGFTRLLDYGILIDGTIDRRFLTFQFHGKE